MKCGPYDVIVVGNGTFGWRALSEYPDVGTIMREQEKADRLIAEICTEPTAMKNYHKLYGRRLTSSPGMEGIVRKGDHYIYKYDDVVKDGDFITSRGNYTTWHFVLSIVKHLSGRPAAEMVTNEMLVPY